MCMLLLHERKEWLSCVLVVHVRLKVLLILDYTAGLFLFERVHAGRDAGQQRVVVAVRLAKLDNGLGGSTDWNSLEARLHFELLHDALHVG